MPSAPPRPCRQPGCPELVHAGYCAAHESHRWDHQRCRGTTASRGYDGHWKRVREEALRRDHYLCVLCLADYDRVTPARDVDHIVPIEVAPELRLDLDNLQSLCRTCHRLKTERDKGIKRQSAHQSHEVDSGAVGITHRGDRGLPSARSHASRDSALELGTRSRNKSSGILSFVDF